MTASHVPSKAVVAIPLAEELFDHLTELEVTRIPGGRHDESFLTAVSDAEGLLVSSGVRVDREVIESAPALRVISTMSVGFDHIDVALARERGIVVTITPVLSDAVADLTMALMTMLARGLPGAMRSVSTGKWREGSAALGADLAHKLLLVVGFGRIGQAVATRALAAKMRIEYVDLRSDLPAFSGVARRAGLAEGLYAADFVTVHVDLNEETRHLMGPAEFAMMKPTSFFVNTSRGGVVDQVALARALTEGEIAGAGLDVLEVEPPRPDDPILTAPNCIVLPHIGSATVETRYAMAQCAVDNLHMVLAGRECPYALS
ncbi:MAG: 2-hydroxyacid dehydrogenase [Acidimicrobiales bacterium]